MPDVDAIVVGSGPNGLAAAIVLARAGRLGARARGGRHGRRRRPLGRADAAGIRARRLLGDPPARGRVAVLPRAAARASTALEWIEPPAALAHPFDDGDRGAARALAGGERRRRSARTTRALAALIGPLVRDAEPLLEDLLGPLRVPAHPLALARFGAAAPRRRRRRSPGSPSAASRRAALFAGLAAHSMLPLDRPPSAAFGLVLGLLGHAVGWPLARGGSQQIADALASYLRSLGGEIETGRRVASLAELGGRVAVLLDVTPRGSCATGRRPAPRPLPPRLGALPLRAGRVQARLGARRADPVAGRGVRARGDRAPRRHARGDRRVGGGAGARRASRSGRSCCSPSRASSTRRARRRDSTPRGRTATSRTARPST